MFLGSLVAAVALAVAAYLHNGWTHSVTLHAPLFAKFANGGTTETVNERYSWQTAVAIFVAVAGVGAGAGIAFRR